MNCTASSHSKKRRREKDMKSDPFMDFEIKGGGKR